VAKAEAEESPLRSSHPGEIPFLSPLGRGWSTEETG